MEIKDKLLQINPYSRSGEKQGKIEYIVVHWVGNANTSAIANRNYFNNLAKTHETSASAHYIVGLNGEVIRCIPDDEVAFHSGNYDMNRKSIGIENCHPDWNGQFNAKTYYSLIELIVELMKKYNLTIDSVIRHYDVTKKECPKYYVIHQEAWEQLKKDVLTISGGKIDNQDIFDSDLYYWKYEDLRKHIGTDYNKLFGHWISNGIKECRIGSYVFDAEFYYNKYKDLQKAFGKDGLALYNHFLTFGIKEGRQASRVFDVKYYAENNTDVKNAYSNNFDIIKHFIKFGIKEYRLSSKDFNVRKYKESYKDLQKAFGNDCKAYYKHYLIFGIKENRKAS